MPVCLLGLGSNLGDRSRHLDLAVQSIGAHPEIQVIAVSRYLATVPVGGPAGQGEFLNAALHMQTTLPAAGLLEFLQQVEKGLQRQRLQRWGARTIDLDILLYDQIRLRSPRLILPHPRMAFRRFVLEPAAEIVPGMVHSELGWSIARLLQHLKTAVPYVAVAGLPNSGKRALAEAVASRCAVRLVCDRRTSTGDQAVVASCASISTHLEILERRRSLLRCDDRSSGVSESIGDFWFEQTLAEAESWLSHADLVRYRERHDRVSEEIVAPKLLVLLEMGPRECLMRVEPSDSGVAGWDEDRLARLERRLVDLAVGAPRQPVLRLDAANRPEAVEEVVAAIHTMR